MKKSSWLMILGTAVLLTVTACGGGGGGGGGGSTSHTVSGTISGLTTGSSIVLQLNGGYDLTVDGDADGIVTFTFDTELSDGDEYEVTILTTPGIGHAWSVANAAGTVGSADISDIRINGQLDETFGESLDGIEVSDGAAGFAGGSDIGYAMAIDASGNIIVVGESERVSGDSDMTVWRFDADGNPDGTFGGGDGAVSYNGSADDYDAGFSVVLEDPGNVNSKILVTGVVDGGDMAVWRLDSDGSLDTDDDGDGGFGGGDGFAKYSDIAAGYDSVGKSILVDASGKILIAGTRSDSEDLDMVIWRYSSAGVIDGAFGTGGTAVFTGSGSVSGDFEGNAMALEDPSLATSSIFVAGTVTSGSSTKMAIWKYSNLGTIDGTFGHSDGITDGVAVYTGSSGSRHEGFSMVLDGIGDILVTGYFQSSSGTPNMAVWNCTATGSSLALLGTSNSAGGGNGDDQGFSITLDGDGNILVTGKSENAAGLYDMALWKIDPSDGTLDTTFGLNGILVDNSAAGGNYYATGRAIAVDGSGNILVAGCSFNDSINLDMALWRYIP